MKVFDHVEVEQMAKHTTQTIKISSELPISYTPDVVVVGGGATGVAAAMAAARNGADTLLIEQRGYLGGMGTAALVPAFCPYSDGEADHSRNWFGSFERDEAGGRRRVP